MAHTAAFNAVVTTMYRLISLAIIVVWIATFVPSRLYARDDGRFTNSPLKEWFDRLASRNGLCCAFADGVSVQDVDWDSQGGHYRVRIYGQWFGRLEKNADGKLAITHVELRPKITWGGDRKPSAEELDKMHHAAHENCFITNSVKTEVRVTKI
jgi:hypothetical protein